MGEDLSFVYKVMLSFMLLSVIVFTGIHFQDNYALENVVKHYSEITAVTGGFTTSQYDDFKNDLKLIGLDPNETDISIKASAPDGTDITSKVTDVTIPGVAGETKYCPRGSKITLTVVSRKKSTLTTVFKMFNLNSLLPKASNRKVYMSERVK